jgi:acyl-CoA thioesterase YciA
MMPRDTNAHGTIFGGVILSHIDTAGAVEAIRHTGHERFVTVAMREVVFVEPVFVGDIVSFYATTTKVGSTSVTVNIVVEANRFGKKGDAVRVTEAEVIYVAVDESRNKVKLNANQ